MVDEINRPITDEEFQLLRDFIAEHFGIYFDDEKRWMLESKLGRLLRDRKYESFFDYYQHLMHTFFLKQSYDDVQFVELLQAITNNETYFDREAYALEALTDFAIPERIKKHPEQSVIRVLSAACSTGEEPLSIAVRLLESGVIPAGKRVEIIAVDIDRKALATAMSGVYRSNAFRSLENSIWLSRYQKYLDRVTTDSEITYVVRPELKSLVSFHQVNLLNADQVALLGKFDTIFCRNMLIYLNDDGKSRVLTNFHSILRPDGFLFLGHSESIPMVNSQYSVIDHPKQLFYQKK